RASAFLRRFFRRNSSATTSREVTNRPFFKLMTVLTVENVTCRKCNMIASVDGAGLCEFCRPRAASVELAEESAWTDFEKEDLYVLGFAIAVLGLMIWFAPFGTR